MAIKSKQNSGIRMMLEEIDKYGYCLTENFAEEVEQFVAPFGDIRVVTDIVVDLTTPALVTSDKALDLHTDHSRVKFMPGTA